MSDLTTSASAAAAPAKPLRTSGSRPLVGALFMLMAGLSFLLQSVSVKLVGQNLEPLQSLFLRYATGIVFILPFIPAMRKAGFVAEAGGHTLRAFLQALASLCWFYALSRVPMAEVTAMGYLQPIYMTLGAALFFGERLAARRLIAIGVALIGVMIVLRPGFREISTGQLASLMQTPLMAAGYLMSKRLSAKTSPEAVLGWMTLLVTIMIAPFAFVSWQPITWQDLGISFCSGLFSTLGLWCVFRAMAAAPVSVTQPVTFLQLIWSISVGTFFFGEPADAMVLIGGTVIVSSVVFIVIREQQLSRAARDKEANS